VEGNYTTYRQRIIAQAARAQVAAKVSQRTAQTRTTKDRQTPSKIRTLAIIEAEVSVAEKQLAEVEALLNGASQVADVTRITELAEEYAAAKATLDALYEEWEAIAS